MNRQEIFDKVAKHLLTQNAPATVVYDGPDGDVLHCVYRSPAGLKCAVGVLIPDELYHPGIEGSGPNVVPGSGTDHLWRPILKHLQIEEDDEGICIFTDDLGFLCGLQEIHDHAAQGGGVDGWPAELKEFAETNGLEYRV
jgi:hypothetical protein